MTNLSALGITSLIAGLIIGTVALVITIIVVIRSKKYLLPILIYSICLLVSLGLIGVFIFDWLGTQAQEEPRAVASNQNANVGNTNQNQNTNVNSNAGVTEPVEVSPTDDDIANLAVQGQIYNEDYGYVIEVGTEHKLYMTEVYMVPFDGVLDTYIYCYETADNDLASLDCPGTAAEVFRINVYTDSQWEAVQNSPFVGTRLDATAGYVYELTHPNGLLPDDVPADDTFYNAVIASFHFAG